MGRNDKCFCESGLKAKRCHGSLNKDSLVGNMIKIYREVDEILKTEVECNCKSNCSACCSDYFYVSEEEFLTIMNYMITKFTDEEINSIKLKAERYMEYIKINHNNEFKKLNTVSVGLQDNLDYEMLTTREWNLKIPCVFLKDGRCSIYEVRPIICRLFGTINKIHNCPSVHVRRDSSDGNKIYKIITEKRINSDFTKILGKSYIERGYPLSDFIISLYDHNIITEKYKVATEKDKIEFVKKKLIYNNYNK